MNTNNEGLPPQPHRRRFLLEGLAVLLGAISGLVPLAGGLAVFLDPLRSRSRASGFIQVASLNALPEDGSPRKFAVVTDQIDAWNKIPQVPVGAVYLRRTGDKAAQAFNVVCPHAGCFVNFDSARQGYHCPCHNSTFGLDGKITDARSPSPRGLDPLDVEIRNGSEIWVKFQNFRAGQAERIPVG